MPPFSDLRSDSPLNFNLFTWLSTDAFEHPFWASRSRHHAVAGPSLIGDRVSCIPRVASRATSSRSDNVAGKSGNCRRYGLGCSCLSAYYCSFECDSSARPSSCKLAQASTLRRVLLFCLAEHLGRSARHARRSLHANITCDRPKPAPCALLKPSAICAVADADLMSASSFQSCTSSAEFRERMHTISDLPLQRLVVYLFAHQVGCMCGWRRCRIFHSTASPARVERLMEESVHGIKSS